MIGTAFILVAVLINSYVVDRDQKDAKLKNLEKARAAKAVKDEERKIEVNGNKKEGMDGQSKGDK
jgi:hypothetical protein